MAAGRVCQYVEKMDHFDTFTPILFFVVSHPYYFLLFNDSMITIDSKVELTELC